MIIPDKRLRLAAYDWHQKKGIEFTPDAIVEAAKKKAHPLHAHFWERDSEQWADVGRYEGARQIITRVKVEFSIGGKSFTTRAVEFVQTSAGGRYADIREIVESPELQAGYLVEIERMLNACLEKSAKLREMISAKSAKTQVKKAA